MPAQLIVGLYPDTLVETEMTAREEPTVVEQAVVEPPMVKPPVIEKPVMEEPKVEQPSIKQPVTEQAIVEPSKVEELVLEEPSKMEEPEMELKTVKEQQAYDYLGKNKKQIIILSTSDKAQYLPDAELKFLTSVLKACGLTIEDVAIMNLKHQTADYAGLQSFFQCRVVLLFGLEPQRLDLPMIFPQFQLQNFSKCTYLHAPALHEIEKQKDQKMKLWVSLKNLFSL